MDWCRFRAVSRYLALVLLSCALPWVAGAQQILQRGPLGMPSQVLDETQQWTTPLPVASDPDQDIYIPDVSNTPWLSKNYPDFENKGVYVVSMFTRYKRPLACRHDLVRWGFSDAAHLDACVDIGYRVRQLSIDTVQKTVTLLFASMIGQDGQMLQDDGPPPTPTRRWAELDTTAQAALGKANQLVTLEMNAYDRKMRSVH